MMGSACVLVASTARITLPNTVDFIVRLLALHCAVCCVCNTPTAKVKALMLTIRLPIAPSANNAFFNRKRGGRGKSAKYRAWIKQADAHYLLQKKDVTPIRGPYICGMIFPLKLRGDLDGRVKLILDWMVSRELTSDDRHLMSYHPVRGDTEDGYVIVQAKEVTYAGSQLPSPTALPE
jgi:Holliday junction resolvase RusA-like endonuclease